MRPAPPGIADPQENETFALANTEYGGDRRLIAAQCRHHDVTVFDPSAHEIAIELGLRALMECEWKAQALHARRLLRVDGVEQYHGIPDVRHQPEARPGIAAEHAPTARQLHLPDRGPIGIEVGADHDRVAVQRR